MKRWTRTSKAELAAKVYELLMAEKRPAEIAKCLGKSDRRIRQIRKLFSLPNWRRRGLILGGKVSPQET